MQMALCQEIKVHLQSLETVFEMEIWIQYTLSKQWDYRTLGRGVQ